MDVSDQLPVGLGKAAVGHGAVDDLVAALAGLQQDTAREEKGIGSGVDNGASARRTPSEPLTSKKRAVCMFEAHVAVRGVDDGIAGSARHLQVAFCLEFRRCLGGRQSCRRE